jgi:hypothetical protein
MVILLKTKAIRGELDRPDKTTKKRNLPEFEGLSLKARP